MWKRVFDEQATTRWSNGCRAWLYSQSDELLESLRTAGVVDGSDM